MNAVGIDVSKGKSMVAIMHPGGEVVCKPYEVMHDCSNLKALGYFLNGLEGETRVIMEYTGRYYEPIARALHEIGTFVSVVNPSLIHAYGNNSLRRVKTDKKDALKLAKYALDNWCDLREFTPFEEVRGQLKTANRQFQLYTKVKVGLKNNLIALLDQTWPGVNTFFDSPVRQDGRQKWVDFAYSFWHTDCVNKLSKDAFVEKYYNWCTRRGYNFNRRKAEDVYEESLGHFQVLPKNASSPPGLKHGIITIDEVMKNETRIPCKAE